MIKFLNSDLMFQTTTEESNDGGTFCKTAITSAEVLNTKTNETTVKKIITIFSADDDYNKENCSVQQSKSPAGYSNVTLRSSDRNKYDSDIYIVAIPFNGFVKPLEKSLQYRIHKALIVRSDKKSIHFGEDAYKKVVYLVIDPNKGLFNEDHKYHVDEITIPIETFNLESRQDADTATVKTTNMITITKDGASIETSSEDVEPVNPEDFKGQMLFPIFHRNPNQGKGGNENKKPYNKGGYTKQATEKESSTKEDSFEKLMDKYGKDSKENQEAYQKRNKKKRR